MGLLAISIMWLQTMMATCMHAGLSHGLLNSNEDAPIACYVGLLTNMQLQLHLLTSKCS